MAARLEEVFLLVSLSCFLTSSLAFGIFDDLLGDTEGCQNICANTYPLHTYEKGVHLAYCQRGCRLFTIINFVHEDDKVSGTRDACALSCKEAYAEQDDCNACITGCDGQVAATQKRKQHLQQLEQTDLQQNVYPLMYVHNMYSNMVDKLWQHMSVQWSFYMQADNGRLVVVRTQPQYYTEYNVMRDNDDNIDDADYKTSNYLETNIAALDNSATPNLKHVQMRPQEIDDAAIYAQQQPAEAQFDWLGCIARKTGMPRLLLSSVILLSAMVMIWLCFTTAATAPEQRIHTQKLSIYGDLDYLKTLDDKALLSSIHPQDSVQASPLPIKVQVERI